MRIATVVIALLITTSVRAADLPSWMAGKWLNETNGVKTEEHWTSAAGGLMLGVNRTVRPGGKTSFEFLRIEQKNGTLTYLAMPGGRPATPFPLKTIGGTRVTFENLEHDFPQRIIYWRDGKRLCGRVEGKMNGKDESEQWCWNRIK